MSATERQYLDRYKNAARFQKEMFYYPKPQKEDGKPNYIGFFLPLAVLSFGLGMYTASFFSFRRILAATTGI